VSKTTVRDADGKVIKTIEKRSGFATFFGVVLVIIFGGALLGNIGQLPSPWSAVGYMVISVFGLLVVIGLIVSWWQGRKP